MSHFSPMNTLTGTMNLPLVVAAITSVGLHSLIWFYQPVVPMADKPNAASDRRSVRVVQLTPQEILRLPEYAQQQAQSTLPLPQAQVPTNLLPNLPESKSEITLPPPPSFPIYNPSPTTPSSTPEAQTSTSRRRDRLTVPKSPQDAVRNNRRNNRSSLNSKPEGEETLTGERSNSQTQTQLRGSQSQQTSQTTSGEFTRVFEQYLAQQNVNNTSQTTSSNQGRNQERGEQTAGTVVDRQGLRQGLVGGETGTETQSRNNGRNNLNSGDAEARLKAIYGYNESNTKIHQGIANYQQWLSEKIKKYADRLNTKREPISDSIRSPFNVKVPDVTPAGIAVLVDPSGKIVGNPELTRSTGYPQFNELAIESVKKRSFPETGKYEIYLYYIDVDQKDLPAVSDAANR